MPDGPPPDDPPAAAAHARCGTGDAAGCADLARYYLDGSRDEGLGKRLVRRAADLEWFALAAPPAAAPVLQQPRDVVAAFRRAFLAEVIPALGTHPSAELARTVAECMAGDAQFLVVRTPRRAAYRALALTRLFVPEPLLAGTAQDLAGAGWVWSVTFLGASRRFPPSGAFAGLVDPADGRLLVAFHIPEG